MFSGRPLEPVWSHTYWGPNGKRKEYLEQARKVFSEGWTFQKEGNVEIPSLVYFHPANTVIVQVYPPLSSEHPSAQTFKALHQLYDRFDHQHQDCTRQVLTAYKPKD